MRWNEALGLLLVLAGGACFEDATPVDETGAMPSSGPECIAGTEGCPCIEGGCVNDLECLSNVCVDAGSTNGQTTDPDSSTTFETATTTPGTTTPATSTSVGTDGTDGTDEGPMTSDSSGDLPQGSPCDPFLDLCAPGLACVGAGMESLLCEVPGPGQQYEPCRGSTCSAGLLCVQTGIIDCMGAMGCCTAMCDLADGGSGCPMELACEALYPMGMAPPGYEDIGVCSTML
jgi:hypothetical protein